jgi:hypothetical protein
VSILYKSNREANAANKITEAKNHFVRNSRFRKLWPEYATRTKADEGSGSCWYAPCRTRMQAEGTFNAAGVGTGSTSQHYDIILGDDFWDEKSVTSPEVMAKTRRDFAQLEYLLANRETGRIVFIGTRFAHDDLTADILLLPAYANNCIIVSGITPLGASLFPENMSMESLFSQAATSHYEFSCQIMLWPTSEDQQFLKEWFQYRRIGELRKAQAAGRLAFQVALLTDASGTGKAESDKGAIIAVACDSLGGYTVVDVVYEKMAANAWLDRCYQMFDKWGARVVARQNVPLESAVMTFVGERNRKRVEEGRRPLGFYDYSLQKKSKQSRMAALQPLYQGGRMFHDPDSPHIGKLEEQITKFPHNTREDDLMDGLAEILDPAVGRAPSAPVAHVAPNTRAVTGASEHEAMERDWRKDRARELIERASGKARRKGVAGRVAA